MRSSWRRVTSIKTGQSLFDVGLYDDGTLYNPRKYDEDDVKASVLAAEERRRQELSERRKRGAKQAAEMRARRREVNLLIIARKMLRDEKIGPTHHCVICMKELTDPMSIDRGIGSECWQHVLQMMERERIAV